MSAVFSSCELFRYRLDRLLDGSGPPVAFCLHNPSKAGASVDDPTSVRGTGYANAWGSRRLTYVNPWAAVATKTSEFWRLPELIGPENDGHIWDVATEVAREGGFVVAAWGAIKPPVALRDAAQARLKDVVAIIREAGCPLRALGYTAAGYPRHPLYMRATATPRLWRDHSDIV